MKLLEVYEEFETIVSEGVEVKHSACDLKTITTVADYYYEDETACEEYWSNLVDEYDLELLMSISDILFSDDDIETIEFKHIVDNIINGNMDDAVKSLVEVDDLNDFFDYLDNYESSEDCLRKLVTKLWVER